MSSSGIWGVVPSVSGDMGVVTLTAASAAVEGVVVSIRAADWVAVFAERDDATAQDSVSAAVAHGSAFLGGVHFLCVEPVAECAFESAPPSAVAGTSGARVAEEGA